ncbi:MAG: zinc ribbon domain-containing protein [Asgard group archaeon]|nr:zinc ribbon domain-containing protein [Asgard group archaeon]
MGSRYRNQRLRSVVSAWISVAFVFFFFYIIGGYVAHWWAMEWWVWMILGFSVLGAISTTIRYIIYRKPSVPDDHATRHYSDDSPIAYVPERDPIHSQPISGSYPKESSEAKFCKYCGVNMDAGSQYCSNCGAPTQ